MTFKGSLAAAALTVVSAGQGVLQTYVSFEGRGFADGVFNAHLHAAPCSADGGGHYNGGDGVTVDAENENWPVVTCARGKCSGWAANGWAPDAADLAGGLSIVVHDTPAASSGSGSKMLCGDLAMSAAGEYKGSLDYLASYAGDGYGKAKKDKISLSVPGTTTAVSFKGAGFGDYMFKAHLHAAPCSSDGGGHFNGGDGVTVDAVNENWPAVTCARGKCWGNAMTDWVPTVAQLAGGLSIVVHDTPAASSGSGSKMLCADLVRSGHGYFMGELGYLASYAGSGYGEPDGMASLTKPELATTASFMGSGFGDNMFKAHLHAAPCSADGGGHYNGGDGVTVDTVNENWPELSCSAGSCSGMAWNDWWVPDSDLYSGLSIVVHDTPAASSGSGAKMLCADLDGRKGQWTGKFSYLASYAGAGYGKAGKSKASLAYGMSAGSSSRGMGMGRMGMGGRGKSGKLAAGLALSSAGTGSALAVGAAAGLLVVAAGFFVQRRKAQGGESTLLLAADEYAVPV